MWFQYDKASSNTFERGTQLSRHQAGPNREAESITAKSLTKKVSFMLIYNFIKRFSCKEDESSYGKKRKTTLTIMYIHPFLLFPFQLTGDVKVYCMRQPTSQHHRYHHCSLLSPCFKLSFHCHSFVARQKLCLTDFIWKKSVQAQTLAFL